MLAVRVAIVPCNAKHKLRHLHYIHEPAEKAATLNTAHHSDNKWNPSHTYLQYRNGFFFPPTPS